MGANGSKDKDPKLYGYQKPNIEILVVGTKEEKDLMEGLQIKVMVIF